MNRGILVAWSIVSTALRTCWVMIFPTDELSDDLERVLPLLGTIVSKDSYVDSLNADDDARSKRDR